MEFNPAFSFEDALGRTASHPWNFSGTEPSFPPLASLSADLRQRMRYIVQKPFTMCSGALSQAQRLAPNLTSVDEKIRAKLNRGTGQKVADKRKELPSSDDEDDSDAIDALPGVTLLA